MPYFLIALAIAAYYIAMLHLAYRFFTREWEIDNWGSILLAMLWPISMPAAGALMFILE